MKAIVNTGPGVLQLLEFPVPVAGPGEARVRTACCGICATDVRMVAGWDRTGFPTIPGHEWSGVVDSVGPGVDPGLRGLPCVGENIRSDGGEVGFEHPGGYGEYFLTEASNLHPIDPVMPLHTAPLIEPLAVAVHVLGRLGRAVGADEPVLVIGDGAIGLLVTAVLRKRGCRGVSLLGGRPPRLAIAKDLGAAAVANYHDFPDGLAKGMHSAFGRRFPLVFEASGAHEAMDAALEVAEGRGTVVEVGDYGSARAAFPWVLVLHGELTIIGSNASAGAWPEAVRLARDLPLERLATHRLPAARFAEGMALMRARDPSVVKIMLDWRSP